MFPGATFALSISVLLGVWNMFAVEEEELASSTKGEDCGRRLEALLLLWLLLVRDAIEERELATSTSTMSEDCT